MDGSQDDLAEGLEADLSLLKQPPWPLAALLGEAGLVVAVGSEADVADSVEDLAIVAGLVIVVASVVDLLVVGSATEVSVGQLFPHQ